MYTLRTRTDTHAVLLKKADRGDPEVTYIRPASPGNLKSSKNVARGDTVGIGIPYGHPHVPLRAEVLECVVNTWEPTIQTFVLGNLRRAEA